mmetsp:Transcript_83262/g.235682  ORF Transcript_83262/g.235682 Transcript_83262/m.235682 type:complete len:203 (-) Transcript_83262:1260-1868(-)
MQDEARRRRRTEVQSSKKGGHGMMPPRPARPYVPVNCSRSPRIPPSILAFIAGPLGYSSRPPMPSGSGRTEKIRLRPWPHRSPRLPVVAPPLNIHLEVVGLVFAVAPDRERVRRRVFSDVRSLLSDIIVVLLVDLLGIEVLPRVVMWSPLAEDPNENNGEDDLTGTVEDKPLVMPLKSCSTREQILCDGTRKIQQLHRQGWQ